MNLLESLVNIASAVEPVYTPVPQPGDAGDRGTIYGFFTDTTLCIGCKACEVACKQWNQLPANGRSFSGNSYDNTMHVGATTWRHVAFKEKMESGAGTDSGNRWLMMSDVCKHCQDAPCQQSCPTGSIIYNEFGDVYVQNDICNGCGYCVAACPFGVIGRAENPNDDGHAHKCTLCMDRQIDGLVPACAKVCPTASIQFGPIEELRGHARERVRELHGRGNKSAYLYGCDSVGDYGPLHAFFLLQDHPNEYNLPENPPQPFRDQPFRYAASLAAGAVLLGLASLFFAKSGGDSRA
jgi:formate dehydrogenase iron-sulfur subunit